MMREWVIINRIERDIRKYRRQKESEGIERIKFIIIDDDDVLVVEL